MTYSTYADSIRPSEKKKAFLYDLLLVIVGGALVTFSARLVIPLSFTPVPITAQTLAVVLIGATLGSKRAAACLITYLTAGAFGVPVFQSGQAGIVYLITSPTGGYLFGFVAAAYLIGFLAERGWDRRYVTTIAAMALGNGVIYVFGLARLAFVVGIDRVLPLGFYPFVLGDLIKILLATLLLPSGWKLLNLTKIHE